MSNATLIASEITGAEDFDFDLDINVVRADVDSASLGQSLKSGPGSIFERCVESGCCI